MNLIENTNVNNTSFKTRASQNYQQSLQTQLADLAAQSAKQKNGGLLDGLFSRANSIGNTVTTTGAAVASPIVGAINNAQLNSMLSSNKSERDNIVQKYGFKDWDDFQVASDNTEEMQKSKYDKMFEELQKVGQSQQDKANEHAKSYANNAIVQKINNTDRYKFAGDAIQTLSTAADVMLPGIMNNPLANGIQGGIEGFAQELSANGENYSLENALRNAAVGSVGGAVTGGIGNKLKAPKGLVGSAWRGAELGALGGAVSGGLNTALNESTDIGDIASGALQGAVSGAKSGAVTGAAMPVVNKAISKTPVLGKLQQGIQNANAEVTQNGIGGAFKKAAASGDSVVANGAKALGNRIKEDVSATANGFKNVGQGIGVLAKNAANIIGDQNGNMVDRYKELKTRRDVNNVLSGKAQSAKVTPKGLEDLPVNYTKETHDYLLSKHPDDTNTEYINDLAHIETMRRPDYVYENSPRDVQYRRLDVTDDGLAGRVSVKPLAEDGASYINTAHVMDGDEALRGVPTSNGKTATAEDFAFNRTSNVDADSIVSQDGQNVNSKTTPTSKDIKNKRATVKDIINQFDAVDKPTSRATKPHETFYNLYSDMGLSDADEIRRAVSYAEPGSLVPKVIREAAGQAGVVDVSDAAAMVTDLKLNKKQNYKKTVAVLEDIIDSTPSSISGGKNGVDALQLQRTLEAMASDARGTSGTYHIGNNVVDQTTANNLSRIAKNIGENLDKAAVQSGAVQTALNKYQTEIQEMRNAFPDNSKWQAKIDNDILGATTIKQLRSSIKDLTRASMFIQSGDENYATFGGRYAASKDIPTTKTGITNKIVNTVVDKAYNSKIARDLRLQHYANQMSTDTAGQGGNAQQASANATTGNGSQSNGIVGTARNLLSNALGLPVSFVSADSVADAWPQTRAIINSSPEVINSDGMTRQAEEDEQNASLEAQLSALAANTAGAQDIVATYNFTPNGMVLASNTGNGTGLGVGVNQRQYQQWQTGLNELDRLRQGMQNALAAGDIDAYNQIATIYGHTYDVYGIENYEKAMAGNSTSSDLNTSEKNQLAKLASANNAIDELESLFIRAGGGQGIVGGNFQNFLAAVGLNDDVGAYNDMAQGLINEIGAAIGKTDALNTEGEVQRALDLIPKITDTAQKARIKLEELRALLNSNYQSYASMYGLS